MTKCNNQNLSESSRHARAPFIIASDFFPFKKVEKKIILFCNMIYFECELDQTQASALKFGWCCILFSTIYMQHSCCASGDFSFIFCAQTNRGFVV